MFNVFNIQPGLLAQWLIPTMLRHPILMAIVNAMYVPLAALHNTFLLFRTAKQYQIRMNYQTCYLEAFLNDRFDFSLRRIYIEDAETVDQVYLYQDEEDRPIYLYQDTENNPVYLYTEGESIGDLLNDFIVWVPIGVLFDENEMRAMIATKLCGKRYKIELF